MGSLGPPTLMPMRFTAYFTGMGLDSMKMPLKMGSRRRCSEAAPSMSPSNSRPIMCLIWFPTRWDATLTTP